MTGLAWPLRGGEAEETGHRERGVGGRGGKEKKRREEKRLSLLWLAILKGIAFS